MAHLWQRSVRRRSLECLAFGKKYMSPQPLQVFMRGLFAAKGRCRGLPDAAAFARACSSMNDMFILLFISYVYPCSFIPLPILTLSLFCLRTYFISIYIYKMQN